MAAATNHRRYEIEVTGLRVKRHKRYGRYTEVRTKVLQGPQKNKVFKVARLGLPPASIQVGGRYGMSAHSVETDPAELLEDQAGLVMSFALSILFWTTTIGDEPEPGGTFPGPTPLPPEAPSPEPEPDPGPPRGTGDTGGNGDDDGGHHGGGTGGGGGEPPDARFWELTCHALHGYHNDKVDECLENATANIDEETADNAETTQSETGDTGSAGTGDTGHTGGTAPKMPVW